MHGMLEAQLARMYLGLKRALRHKQADQVLSQRV
jgi:hypothetical protein